MRTKIFQQALPRGEIVFGAGMIGIPDQRAIIENIAGEQNFVRLLVKSNTSWRMIGRVDNFEYPVAEIDHVTIVKNARRRSLFYGITCRTIGFRLQGVKNLAGDAGIDERRNTGRIRRRSRYQGDDRFRRVAGWPLCFARPKQTKAPETLSTQRPRNLETRLLEKAQIAPKTSAETKRNAAASTTACAAMFQENWGPVCTPKAVGRLCMTGFEPCILSST